GEPLKRLHSNLLWRLPRERHACGRNPQQAGDQGGPAGLVTCPQAAASVPVEVFVEEDVVTPVRVIRVALEGSVTGPRPTLLRHEQRTEPLREFVRHAIEVHQLARSGRAFDPEAIAVIAVILAQSLDQQKIDW